MGSAERLFSASNNFRTHAVIVIIVEMQANVVNRPNE